MDARLWAARCQLRTHAPQLSTSSFDHLVGAAEQREWNGNAERFRCLEVDNQLDLRCLLDRHVARFFAFENTAGVDANQPVILLFTASVANQAACLHEWVVLINRSHRVADRHCAKLLTVRVEDY